MADSQTDWDNWDFCIRIAGNTGRRCLFAIWQKGYAIRHYYLLKEDGEYQSEFDAKKDGRLFSATSPEELLGLIALWETRGDSWRDCTADEEFRYNRLDENAITFDQHSNVVDEP